MNLNGVQLGAEDAKKLAAFYTKVFGEPKWAMEGDWYGWDVGAGHLFFGPHSEIRGQAREPQRMMIALEDADVQGAFTKCIEAGAREVAAPYNPDPDSKDFWLATVADPEGNYLQLSSPMSEGEA
jgi:predicted enzyme related to lactoylglutathione lyase